MGILKAVIFALFCTSTLYGQVVRASVADVSSTIKLRGVSIDTFATDANLTGGDKTMHSTKAIKNYIDTRSVFTGEVSGPYNNTTTIKWTIKTVTAPVGSSTFTVSGVQPSSLQKVRVCRNGVEQILGVHVTYSGGVYSFSRPTQSGELWAVYFLE